MNFKLYKTSILILGITSVLCSRIMFALFKDPEGTNLLVVTATAVIVYSLSLSTYLFFSSTSLKKLALAISIQIIIVAVFYTLLS